MTAEKTQPFCPGSSILNWRGKGLRCAPLLFPKSYPTLITSHDADLHCMDTYLSVLKAQQGKGCWVLSPWADQVLHTQRAKGKGWIPCLFAVSSFITCNRISSVMPHHIRENRNNYISRTHFFNYSPLTGGYSTCGHPLLHEYTNSRFSACK